MGGRSVLLAQTTDASGWYLGFGIGIVVVIVVVVVVTWILLSAATIRREAGQATRALREVQRGTAPLWRVADVNTSVARLVEQTTAARRALGG